MAIELNVDIDDLLNWDKTKFERWYAFFTLRDERRKKESK